MFIVVRYHFFERIKATIVHIGRSKCNIPQGYHPEPSPVESLPGNFFTPGVYRHAVEPVVMKKLVESFGATMTMAAGRSAYIPGRIGIGIKQRYPILFGGCRLVLAPEVFIVAGTGRNKRALKLR